MEKKFFTSGPSQLYPTIKIHLQSAIQENICSISHRGSLFQTLFKDTTQLLKTFLHIPDSYQIFFLSSATEAMGRIIGSCVDQYSFHLVNGAFSYLFYNQSVKLKKKALKHELPLGCGFDIKQIKIPKKIELICITHNETSTGVQFDLRQVSQLKQKNPQSLLALDIVSSAPYVNVNYSLFDLVFFSVQKGFGLPAGLGVLIVSKQALQKARDLKLHGRLQESYHDFINLEKYAGEFQTPTTPNVLLIYLLNKVISDMKKRGISLIREETEQKAELLYKFFELSSDFKPFVSKPRNRSKTVCVAEAKFGSSYCIKQLMQQGFVIGSGYKELKEKQIRIANFPAHTLQDVQTLIMKLQMLTNKKNK